ncbi:hypothetical protein LTR05_006201 [Lithohypha guttulata]|uniref:Uncharacterized protein n=1 Tax=Lithohypha guttulata TaxID=1690604 RepID=A0AAN7SY95_9EURO|nr:hypothetical protein LTR05_006201 [Lithohypha guttulata]
MASSVILSTSVLISTSLSTAFSTIYQTSKPVVVTTLTSVASQLSTFVQSTTITKSDIVMASTLSIPTTVTYTLSQVLTSYAPASTPTIAAAPLTVTATITSTLFQPPETLTYWLPPPPPPPTTTTVSANPTEYLGGIIYAPLLPVTVTELIFFLENAAGNVYSTITTTIAPSTLPTSPIIIVPGKEEPKHGWDSWNDSQKGGLIAGVVLAFLLLLGLLGLLWLCLRRRNNVWVASDWTGTPVVQQSGNAVMVPQTYWGPGPAGWGLRN